MDPSETKSVRTAADDLVEVVKRHKKIAVDDLAKMLKLPVQSVQAIIDFLVEEKVLDMEYKFTTPYVYLSEGRFREQRASLGAFSKEEFITRAREKGIAEDEIAVLWKRYLAENLPQIRQHFMAKAYARGATAEKAEELWLKYLTYL
jgi:phage antirepressor YoqD-like protein